MDRPDLVRRSRFAVQQGGASIRIGTGSLPKLARSWETIPLWVSMLPSSAQLENLDIAWKSTDR